MKTSFVVTVDDCRHSDDAVDPRTPGFGEHLPFHTLLQRCGLAWRGYLGSLPHVTSSGIVPRIDAQFLSEAQPGHLDIETRLTKLGDTSFSLRCDVSQGSRVVAVVDVVLVNFDYETRRPVPLTEAQRSVLRGELTA